MVFVVLTYPVHMFCAPWPQLVHHTHCATVLVDAQSLSFTPQPQSHSVSPYQVGGHTHPGMGAAAEIVPLGTERQAPPEVAVKLPLLSRVPAPTTASAAE